MRQRQVAAVDLSTETAAVTLVESCWRAGGKRRRWNCGGCGGSVDGDGGSECGGIARVSQLQEVDLSIETASVASMQSSLRVWRQQCRWIRRQRRRQWHHCSRGDESGDGNDGGSVDRDGVSGCVAIKPTNVATATEMDPLTETVALAPL